MKWASLILLSAFAVIVLPTWRPPIIQYDTLDGSYRAVLNDPDLRHLSVGDELVTTAGPLGFLRNRDFWPKSYGLKLGWDLLICLGFLLSLWSILWERDLKVTLLFSFVVVAVLAVVRFDLFYMTTCLHTWYLFTRTEVEKRSSSVASIVLAAALAIASWVLFTYLLMSLVVILAGDALYAFRFRRFPLTGLFYLFVLSALWFATGHDLQDLGLYFKYSFEVADGYVESHVLPGGYGELAPIVLASAALCTIALLKDGARFQALRNGLLGATALCAVFLLTFRSAFVRFELMRALEFSTTVAMAALYGTVTWSRQESLRRWPIASTIVAGAFVLGGAVLNIVASSKISLPQYLEAASSTPGLKFRQMGQALSNPQRLKARNEAAAAEIRERFPVGALPGRVDMHGSRQGIVVASGVRYSPRPVFQSFQAGTPALARLNGEHLRGELRPDYLLVELQSSLGLPKGVLDSEAWLELFQGYSPVRLLEGVFNSAPDGLLVLQKRERRQPIPFVEVSSLTVPLGEMVEIPASVVDEPIWAIIEVEETFAGRFARTFLKLPVLKVQFILRSGAIWSFPFSSRASRGGFLLSPQVRSVNELHQLLITGLRDAPPSRQVVAFRVYQDDGPLSARVRGSVKVRLRAGLTSNLIGRPVEVEALPEIPVEVRLDPQTFLQDGRGDEGSLDERVAVTGRILTTEEVSHNASVAIAVDGRVEGVGWGRRSEKTLEKEFAVVVPRSAFQSGTYNVSALIVVPGEGGDIRLFRPQSSGVDKDGGLQLLEASDSRQCYKPGIGPNGSRLLTSPTGKVLDPTTADLVAHVDRVQIAGQLVVLSGWAFDRRRQQPATAIAVTRYGQCLGAGKPRTVRQDLVGLLGSEARAAGYTLVLPQGDFGEPSLAGLEVFAILDHEWVQAILHPKALGH